MRPRGATTEIPSRDRGRRHRSAGIAFRSRNAMKECFARFVATAAYIGTIPGAPGTYASVATTLALAALIPRGEPARTELLASIIAGVTIVGVLASADVARAAGIEDPQTVVIDEVAGQLLAFLLVPLTAANLVLGTILFRIFDMWKPFPLRRLELLPNGVGIMADDLGAGVYANLLLQLATVWLRS